MDEAPCGHEHDLDRCRPGYRGPAARWWRVVEDVVADRAGRSYSRTERVDVPAGTHLRLDQTDYSLLVADMSQAWIDQRFLVLDGPLAGECVAFVAREPGLDVSWVPAAIASDEAGA